MKTFIKNFTLSLGMSSVLATAATVGESAPAFTLTSAAGKTHSLKDFAGKTVVLEWLNHGCPFVKKHYASGNMQKLQKDAVAKGVVWLSIVSSAPGKQGHMEAPEALKQASEVGSAATAVLLDPSGEVGRMYDAKVTPHMFVVNPKGVVVYNGAIDDKPSTNSDDIKGAKNFVVAALDSTLAGKDVAESSTKPYGCSVKYE